MTCRIGINGFGRIGRMVLRRTLALPDTEVVAVNDLADIGDLAYLLKYDSVHGVFASDITSDHDAIYVDGRAIRFSSEAKPADIPWGRADVDVVIESTGALRSPQDAAQHLRDGVQKVLISAPSDGVDITLVPGVNDAQYNPGSAPCHLDGVLHHQFAGPSGQGASRTFWHCPSLYHDRTRLYGQSVDYGQAHPQAAAWTGGGSIDDSHHHGCRQSHSFSATRTRGQDGWDGHSRSHPRWLRDGHRR